MKSRYCVIGRLLSASITSVIVFLILIAFQK